MLLKVNENMGGNKDFKVALLSNFSCGFWFERALKFVGVTLKSINHERSYRHMWALKIQYRYKGSRNKKEDSDELMLQIF